MKKWIATSAIAASLVFAFALARAEDSYKASPSESLSTDRTSENISSSESESKGSMSGKVGEDVAPARPAKTCTDKAGTVYRIGHKGYEHCMSDKAAALRKEQSGRVHETKEVKETKETFESGMSTEPSSSTPESNP